MCGCWWARIPVGTRDYLCWLISSSAHVPGVVIHRLPAVAELRKEQEEEISLEERLAEQRNLHQHAIQKYQEAASRLHDLEATIGARARTRACVCVLCCVVWWSL